MNVTEDKALLLPGRVPGFKRIDVKLLPSSMTKSRLWKSYQGACAAKRTRICWLLKATQLSSVIVEPTLPFHCYDETSVRSLLDIPEEQEPNSKISEFTGCSKGRSCKAARKPFEARFLIGERDFYKNWCKTSKDTPTEHLIRNVEFSEKRAPCSLEGT